jgi:NAD(P)-dependent dehydrogenase (short-subunit alcohol dehydrogenase family)
MDALNNPVTIITGGGSGLGAALAGLLTERGHRVVIAGRRQEQLEETARLAGAYAVTGDVSTELGAQHLIDSTISHFGRIDNLVLNAAVTHHGPVQSLPLEDWRQTIDVNLTANFMLCQAALPALIESRGNIVAVSSIGALRSGFGMAAYAASKAGLMALIKNVAFDYGPQGVRANIVCPGWIRTEMSDQDFRDATAGTGVDVNEVFERVAKIIPLQRASTALEQAKPIAWLLSEEAAYVNGAELVVDGGTTMTDALWWNMRQN